MMTPDDSKHSLAINALSHHYDDQVLFTNLNITLQSGEMLVITGSNGSGKSTLLRLLAGLHETTHGNIVYDNIPILNNPIYQTNLHYLSHQNGLKTGLTVFENIQLMLLLHHAALPSQIDNIIKQLSLDHAMSQLVRHLSAGQQKRVALLKLFLIPKLLWLLDEPLASLDHATQLLLQDAINKKREEGGIVIASSHQAFTMIKDPICSLVMSAS